MMQRGCSYEGSTQYARTRENPARLRWRASPRKLLMFLPAEPWLPRRRVARAAGEVDATLPKRSAGSATWPHHLPLAIPTYRHPPGRRIRRHSCRSGFRMAGNATPAPRASAPAHTSSTATQSNAASRYGSSTGAAQTGATFAYPSAVISVHEAPSGHRSRPRQWTLVKCSASPAVWGTALEPRSRALSHREISASHSQLLRPPPIDAWRSSLAASGCARRPRRVGSERTWLMLAPDWGGPAPSPPQLRWQHLRKSTPPRPPHTSPSP